VNKSAIHWLKYFALALSISFVAACATTQQMPAARFSTLVVDRETKNPIPNALVQLVYVGVGNEYLADTATTSAEGTATLEAAAASLPSHMGDWYFAGGYLREFRVKSDGYEDYVYTEGPYGFGSEQVVLKLRRSKK